MGIQFSGLASGLDTDSIIKDLMKVERMRVDKVFKRKEEVVWKKEAWQDMNKKIFDFYTNDLFKFKSSSGFMEKNVTNTNDTVATIIGDSSSIEGNHTLEVTAVAKGSYLTSDVLGNDLNTNPITQDTTAEELIDFGAATEITVKVGSEGVMNDVTIEKTDTVSTILSKIQTADSQIKMNYDTSFNRIFASTTETGANMEIQFDSNGSTLFEALGFTTVAGVATGSTGEDAEFTYNGTALTSSTNDVTLGEVSVQIHSVGTTNISVTTDVDAMYDNVKNFVSKYNELLSEMNAKVYADSVRGYDPLTSDEKKAMTEDEIKLWEEKAKSDLLRNDTVLSGLVSSMRSIMVNSDGVDTTDMDYQYLSDLGIETSSNYREKGLLHIHGDEDDSLFSLKDDKLREALETNSEGVAEFLNALGQELYDDFTNKMQSTDLSSAFTFYNDKQMTDQINVYEDKMYDLEQKLVDIEERYHRQFTAMEKAIQQANSTGSWLAQQLGGM